MADGSWLDTPYRRWRGMQLEGALFEHIAAGLDGGAPRPPDARRREPRVDVDARVTVIPLTDSLAVSPFEVTLRDFSPGGIGFLHTGRIALDEQFVVLLPDGGGSVAVLCQVAYYQPVAERAWSVGARFLRVLRRRETDGATTLPLAQPAPVRRRAAS
jgi:hypothetical protein